MRRVLVGGLGGSGKTTLARRLATRLGVPVVELDDLYLGAGLQMRPDFPTDLAAATAGDGWVVDSLCPPHTPEAAAARERLWSLADTVVRLDYRRPVVLRRAVVRSVGRIARRERLWVDHRDSFRGWLDPAHPVRRAATGVARTSRLAFEARVADPRWSHLDVVRLPSPRGAERWLASLPATT